MANDIAVKQDNPTEMIRYAIEKNATVEQIEKLLAIKERYEANEARKAYHSAMAKFKSDPPKIEKDKSVSFGSGKASYKHASLYNVTQKISEALSKHGLSASWTTKQNGVILVTCHITHVLGHSEECTLSAPSDVSGSKNPIQAIGSTVTYLERYTLLALCGLATVDSDDDGQASITEYIDEKEYAHIVELVEAYSVIVPAFLNHMKVESLDKIKKSDYQKAVSALEAKGKKIGAGK